LQRAEDLLDVGCAGENSAHWAVLIDPQGGLRIIDAAGWSMARLRAEYGPDAVYKIDRRNGTVRVEGWDGADRCLVERTAPTARRPIAAAGYHSFSVMPPAPCVQVSNSTRPRPQLISAC
jgi:hypothetical protein